MRRSLLKQFIAFSFLFFAASSFAQTVPMIYHYAGLRYWGYSGDGGDATQCQMNNPTSVVTDAAGNVYFADSQNHRIRKIVTTGTLSIVTTIAGTGEIGFAGDSGLAINAKFYYPVDLAMDASGNLYVADQYNNRIRKITPAGMIYTFAGSGKQGWDGDGGPATEAKLNYPRGITFDPAGNMYISDTYNYRIRKVTTAGTMTTIAGNGTPGWSGDGDTALKAQMQFPHGIAADGAGNVYFSDPNNYIVRKIAPNGKIYRYAGNGIYSNAGDGGLADTGCVAYPSGLHVDAIGNLYIVDRAVNTVRIVDATTKIISTFGGVCCGGFTGDGSTQNNMRCRNTYDVTFDAAGNYYIADNGNQRIRKVAVNGTVTLVSTLAGGGTGAFSGDGGQALNAELNYPSGADFDPSGNLYVADQNSHRIRKITPAGVITTYGGTGTQGYSGDGGLATAANMNYPLDVACDGFGNVFVAEFGSHTIRKIDPTGTITTVAGNGLAGFTGDNGPATSARLFNPFGVATDAAGNVYISDYNNDRIRMVNMTSGTITTVVGSGASGYNGDTLTALLSKINGPKGIVVDAAGNIYFADYFNHRVRKVGPATGGTLITIAGNGLGGYSGDITIGNTTRLNYPTGVDVDGLGNVFIADQSNHRIRIVSTGSVINTYAGVGVVGYTGDMGPAADAHLRSPYDLAVDAANNVFVVDRDNNRIREICPASCAIGINELQEKLSEKGLLVYPNPNNGDFTVKGIQKETLNVVNQLGQNVKKIDLDPNTNFTATVSGLPIGFYFIAGKTSVQKIIVVK